MKKLTLAQMYAALYAVDTLLQSNAALERSLLNCLKTTRQKLHEGVQQKSKADASRRKEVRSGV